MDGSVWRAAAEEVAAGLLRAPLGVGDVDVVERAYRDLFPTGPPLVWVGDTMEFTQMSTIDLRDVGRYISHQTDSYARWYPRWDTFNMTAERVAKAVDDVLLADYSHLLRASWWWRCLDQVNTVQASTLNEIVRHTPGTQSFSDTHPLWRTLPHVSLVRFTAELWRAGVIALPFDVARGVSSLATLYQHALFDVFPQVALFVRAPEIHRDGRLRLHRSDGPSIHWGNEALTYHLQGESMAPAVIRAPGVDSILRWCTTWQQLRPAAQVYGWDRFVDELALSVIDKGPDEYSGTLYFAPDAEAFVIPGWARQRGRLLVGRNGSPNRDGSWNWYGFLFPDFPTTVAEAHATLWGVETDTWRATAVRT